MWIARAKSDAELKLKERAKAFRLRNGASTLSSTPEAQEKLEKIGDLTDLFQLSFLSSSVKTWSLAADFGDSHLEIWRKFGLIMTNVAETRLRAAEDGRTWLVLGSGGFGGTWHMAKDTAAKKPLTKTQLVKALAEATGLKKADVDAVLNALTEEIKKALSPRGPGAFVLPGLLKIKRAKTKPTPARQMPKPGKPDEIITIPAKPARNTVRIRALKQLKAMV